MFWYLVVILNCNKIISLFFFQRHFWIFQASSSDCANWPHGRCLKQQGLPASCRSWRSGTPGWTTHSCWMHWWEWQMKRQSRAVQVPGLHCSTRQQLMHVLTFFRVCHVLLFLSSGPDPPFLAWRTHLSTFRSDSFCSHVALIFLTN